VASDDHTDEDKQEEEQPAPLPQLPSFPVVGLWPWYIIMVLMMAYISWEVISQFLKVVFA
jgi:hypothetical protein